jgi:hypothetical protein
LPFFCHFFQATSLKKPQKSLKNHSKNVQNHSFFCEPYQKAPQITQITQIRSFFLRTYSKIPQKIPKNPKKSKKLL